MTLEIIYKVIVYTNHKQMKLLLSFLIILLNLIGFSQQKNCNSINIPGRCCEVQVLSKVNDTIKCFVEDDCSTVNYDLSKNATWITYFENSGKIREIISYKNGLCTNMHTQYFRNGQLMSQSNYEKGELVGPYLSFYENGNIHWSGTHVNERFIGTIYQYWDNGRIAEIIISTESSFYRKYVTYYHPMGNSISEIEFKQMWNCN